jgi:hypothetical protein
MTALSEAEVVSIDPDNTFLLDVSTQNKKLWNGIRIKDGMIVGDPEKILPRLRKSLLDILERDARRKKIILISGVCPQWVNSFVSAYAGREFNRVYRTNKRGDTIRLIG